MLNVPVTADDAVLLTPMLNPELVTELTFANTYAAFGVPTTIAAIMFPSIDLVRARFACVFAATVCEPKLYIVHRSTWSPL